MSFLNSVLSNIGKEGDTSRPPLPQAPAKRKADETPADRDPKATKVEDTTDSRQIGSLNPQLRKLAGQTSKVAKQPQVALRHGAPKNATSSTSVILSKEVVKQPKKGSFREIMSRGQSTAGPAKPAIGTISHKARDRTELSYKKGIKLEKQTRRDKKLGTSNDKSRSSSNDGRGSGKAEPMSRNRDPKPAQPAYGGTAKSLPKNPPSFGGTAHLRKSKEKPKAKRSANEYAGTDDELDSYGEDEIDDYGYSEEDSDDMEAGFSDVEGEEESALKIARKEDEEEQRLENRLKKEKDERKKKLEDLARKSKAQKR